MTYRFTARAAGCQSSPQGGFPVAALGEDEDGGGFVLIFMAGEEEPDAQDRALGMDTHCLVTAEQGTAYGCVREAVLTGNVLRLSLAPEALEQLDLDDSEIEAVIQAPAEDLAAFRRGLAEVLNYGRPDARPTLLSL